MGTLKKLRHTIRTDNDLRKMLVRGSRNEILLDIDGDKEADIAFQEIYHDGNIDRIALDVTGNGIFDLYIDDTDRNGIPDHIFYVEEGNEEEMDKVVDLAAGPEVEQAILDAAQAVAFILDAEEVIADELSWRLKQLEANVYTARKYIDAMR